MHLVYSQHAQNGTHIIIISYGHLKRWVSLRIVPSYVGWMYNPSHIFQIISFIFEGQVLLQC